MGPKSPMLHTKFQGNRPTGSREVFPISMRKWLSSQGEKKKWETFTNRSYKKKKSPHAQLHSIYKHLQSFRMIGSKVSENSARQGTHSIYNIHVEWLRSKNKTRGPWWSYSITLRNWVVTWTKNIDPQYRHGGWGTG